MRFYQLSCEERPAGSLLPFGRDDVGLSLNPYPPHYRTAFAFSGIPCPHPQQLSLRSACPFGRRYGFTVFHVSDNGRLGVGSFPVGVVSSLRYPTNLRPPTCLLAQAFQRLWLVSDNGIYHRFTLLRLASKPSTPPRGARSSTSTSRFQFHPCGMGCIVRMASNETVASLARTPRLLPEERQVPFKVSLVEQSLTRLHVARRDSDRQHLRDGPPFGSRPPSGDLEGR